MKYLFDGQTEIFSQNNKNVKNALSFSSKRKMEKNTIDIIFFFQIFYKVCSRTFFCLSFTVGIGFFSSFNMTYTQVLRVQYLKICCFNGIQVVKGTQKVNKKYIKT